MPNTAKIRELNDAFRKSFQGGKTVVTRGVAARTDLAQVIRQVQTFNQFDEGNDPYGEHEFAGFMMSGEQLFWSITYYGVDLESGSPDPADPAVTCRVLTIMLAEEY
jgi:hypothetical protein